jgi:hypothetical protein
MLSPNVNERRGKELMNLQKWYIYSIIYNGCPCRHQDHHERKEAQGASGIAVLAPESLILKARRDYGILGKARRRNLPQQG